MNNIKGYGFRPSDEELIGYLQDIACNRDSLVQYITQLEDICEFEPSELPGLSVLHPDGKVWYFIYSLNYKYQNGKLFKRVTKEGYWKPTGRRRKIMASDTKAEIGSKRTLAFHDGRPKSQSSKKSKTKHDNNRDKTNQESNRNKTKHGRKNRQKAVWVMHEYQLNTATPPNQKALFLGKLMKQSEKTNISNNKCEPSHHSPSNSRNEVAMDATTPEEQSDSRKLSADVEESEDSGGNQSSTNEQDNDTQNNETYPQERNNQHNFVDKNEVSNLAWNLGNYAADEAISRDWVDINRLLLTDQESPNASAVVQNQFSTSEHGNPPQNSAVVDTNKTYPEERSNQAKNESFNPLASFENDDAENFYPMDLSDYDFVNLDNLLIMLESHDKCNVIQNQSSTNEQDAETRNSLPEGLSNSAQSNHPMQWRQQGKV